MNLKRCDVRRLTNYCMCPLWQADPTSMEFRHSLRFWMHNYFSSDGQTPILLELHNKIVHLYIQSYMHIWLFTFMVNRVETAHTGSHPSSHHLLSPIRLHYLLACLHVFPFLVFIFLFLSCPPCSTGGGGAWHEEVPAEDCGAALCHQKIGGQKCTARRREEWTSEEHTCRSTYKLWL